METETPIRLTDITTRWSAVHEPNRFVLRYAGAIRRYLYNTMTDHHAADEVLQDFLLHVSRGGFDQVEGTAGKFRHYLIRSIRNCMISYYRRQQRHASAPLPEQLAAPQADDNVWLREWQRCLIERTWNALREHEQAHPRSMAYTLLRLRVEHADADGRELARLLNQQTGQTIQEAAVRKQLSRARQMFAQFLIEEVAATMDNPNEDALRHELIEADFMRYVEPHLAKNG